MHRANNYVSIRIYTEVVVSALNHEEEIQGLERLLWGKGSVCVVLCYNSDLFVTGATDIIIVICSKPCSANCRSLTLLCCAPLNVSITFRCKFQNVLSSKILFLNCSLTFCSTILNPHTYVPIEFLILECVHLPPG